MKVFISWSGNTSQRIAEKLKEWLPGVIQAVRPYFSPDDIAKGTRWNTEIAKNLDESKVGILCLTSENLSAPWILFEAGALSKGLGTARVAPLLFGLDETDVKGPLVQFQAARFDRKEMRKVLGTINDALGESALPKSVLDSVYEMWWPKLEESVGKILAKNKGFKGSGDVRSDRDLLEEVLQLLRNQATLASQSEGLNFLENLTIGFEEVVRRASDQGVLYSFKEEMAQFQGILRAAFMQSPSPPKRLIHYHKRLREALRVIENATEPDSYGYPSSKSDDDDIPF